MVNIGSKWTRSFPMGYPACPDVHSKTSKMMRDTLDTIQEGTHSDIQATMDTELNDATGTQFPIIICGWQRVLSCCR
ncbi:hypothetical protein PPTG_25015, partial [Phytophthora nicotianae INRA-310]